MATWPIFPQVKLSTTEAFFSAAEAEIRAKGIELPIHRDELNFVFEGCYTSESRIKFANRKGENDLVETEAVALAARGLCGMAYPQETINECWRRSMFLQFHDILPGSGVKETVEHALGLFQENLANTGMIRTQCLRALANWVNTAALVGGPKAGGDLGLGGGAGEGAWWGGVSTLGAGAAGVDPFIVFDPAPFKRDVLVRLKIWNRELQDGNVVVRDATGNAVPGQIVERGHYWGHNFAVVVFPAKALPAMGYRAYVVEPGTAAALEGCATKATAAATGAYVDETGRPVYGLGYVNAQLASPVRMGNEFLELTVSSESGGIISLVDKETGQELVPGGFVLGAIEREQEAPHGMTAWQLGAIVDRVEPLTGSTLQVLHKGPHLAAVRLTAKHNESEYALTISVTAGSRQIDFTLDVNWLERGDPATGVPALRASFPLDVANGQASFEIACGTIERPADGEEAPALNWADLTGELGGEENTPAGATLLNDCKYGHGAFEDALRLTLLRSSYDPDPLPEIGRHSIRYALLPHMGPFEPRDAIRAGHAFNHSPVAVGTTVHEGELPAEASLLEVLTPNVMVSGVKKAEDSEALIVRLYEFEGEETEAKVRIAPGLMKAGAEAVETDVLEQPLAKSTAKVDGEVLKVKVPAFGIATVRVGDGKA
jgi:alpha-mannosidase